MLAIEPRTIHLLPATPAFARMAADSVSAGTAALLGSGPLENWLKGHGVCLPVQSPSSCHALLRDGQMPALLSFPELYAVLPDNAIMVEYRGRSRWFSVVESYLAAKHRIPLRTPVTGRLRNVVRWKELAAPNEQTVAAVQATQREAIASLETASSVLIRQLPRESWQGDCLNVRSAFFGKLLVLRTKAIRQALGSGAKLDLATITQLSRDFALRSQARAITAKRDHGPVHQS